MCNTYHIICSLLNLCISIRPAPKVGVKGVSGSTMTSGIGTIWFVLTDGEGIKYIIQLDNVIYLLESAKNLSSVYKWSDDKCDDCGVITRSRFSIFIWDQDTNTKYIYHPPDWIFSLSHSMKETIYPNNDQLDLIKTSPKGFVALIFRAEKCREISRHSTIIQIESARHIHVV